MELWARGFNAWGQLQFRGEVLPLPLDLTEFTCVLEGQEIVVLKTSTTATLIRTKAGLEVSGCLDDFISLCLEDDKFLEVAAVAGNGKIAVSRCIHSGQSILQYESIQKFQNSDSQQFVTPLDTDVKQISANQTSFTALSSDGKIWTWGDASPANVPSVVEDLLDLADSIQKVSSGGHMTAVLTSGNDVYYWGSSPQRDSPLNGSPTPLDLEGHDFLDVAVGFDQMILLTTHRRVFVMDEQMKEKEICLPLKHGQQVARVHAGYKNLLLVVENIKP